MSNQSTSAFQNPSNFMDPSTNEGRTISESPLTNDDTSTSNNSNEMVSNVNETMKDRMKRLRLDPEYKENEKARRRARYAEKKKGNCELSIHSQSTSQSTSDSRNPLTFAGPTTSDIQSTNDSTSASSNNLLHNEMTVNVNESGKERMKQLRLDPEYKENEKARRRARYAEKKQKTSELSYTSLSTSQDPLASQNISISENPSTSEDPSTSRNPLTFAGPTTSDIQSTNDSTSASSNNLLHNEMTVNVNEAGKERMKRLRLDPEYKENEKARRRARYAEKKQKTSELSYTRLSTSQDHLASQNISISENPSTSEDRSTYEDPSTSQDPLASQNLSTSEDSTTVNPSMNDGSLTNDGPSTSNVPTTCGSLEIRDRYSRSIRKDHPHYYENTYKQNILQGPDHKCECCSGLFFQTSVRKIESAKYLLVEGINQRALPSHILLCGTCHRYVSRKKVPPISTENGFCFPDVPPELRNLTELECRMISPRLPFMQIRKLGVDQQRGIRGNVVNVPVSIDSSVSILPRYPSDTQVVQIKLKRKKEYQHHYMFETVRPKKIMEALKFLMATPLYLKHEITVSADVALEFSQSNSMDFISNEEDIATEVISNNEDMATEVSNTPSDGTNPRENAVAESQDSPDSDDDWEECDDEASFNNGNRDTLLVSSEDLITPEIESIAYAPGEGQRPQSLLYDEDSEYLSFPQIYVGQGLKLKANATLMQQIKFEFRNSDRRCATNIPKILYSYVKLVSTKLRNAVNIHMRQSKSTTGQPYTAGALRAPGSLDSLVRHDDGYKVLETVRSSPGYLQQREKDILAMVRQLGKPTWFLTLSAAETKWEELLQSLCVIAGHPRETVEEYVKTLGFMERAKLINEDPVTCSRYFDYRLREFFKFLRSKETPIGNVDDYYIRIEFQMRGSPHAHILVWNKNAPQLKSDNLEEVITFIDSNISCSKGDGSEKWNNLVKLQTHKHSRTCRKKNDGGQSSCRFGIPFPPMRKSIIYDPSKRDENENVERVEARSKLVRNAIENLKVETAPETFEEFLETLNMTEDEYIAAVTYPIRRSTVLLKRSPQEIRINPYNKKILELWNANMDLQYVLDPYACVVYIVSYIGKAQKGMSMLLREAIKEAKNKGSGIKERLKVIANKFIHCEEVGAQECCYILLSIPICRSSRALIYVNTSPPEERVHILKRPSELDLLPDDSTNVFSDGLIEHYVARPDELENLSLAVFASWYEFSRSKRNKRTQNLNEDENQEDETVSVETSLELKDSSGFVRKRMHAKVIRFRKYSMVKDLKNYCRVELMLFLPWRCEKTELLEANVEEIYEAHKLDVLQVRREFVSEVDDLDLDQMIQEVRENQHTNDIQNIQPMIEHQNERDRNFTLDDPDYFVNSLQEAVCDITSDIQQSSAADFTPTITLVNNEEYYSMLRKLNLKQREIFYYVLNHFKTSQEEPLRILITGGAGVGKSLLIKAIFEAVSRHEKNKPGADPSVLSVLRTAFTGKAAFNIDGVTLHSAFNLPTNQFSGKMNPLDSDTLNRKRCSLLGLKLLIIDEISMCGAKIFNYVNVRAQQIFGCSKHFGGLSVILVGDYNQLPPVGDNYTFMPLKEKNNPYAALIGSPLWEEFKLYELNEIMRQKDDKIFAMALNRMSMGEMTPADIVMFQGLETSISRPLPLETLHLFATNDEVNAFNALKLCSLNAEKICSVSFDSATGDASNEIKTRILEAVKTLKTQETSGLPRELTLMVGIRYMITNNLNTADGLVNGATGRLRKIEYGQNQKGEQIPVRVWIEFSDEKTGKETRAQSQGLMTSNNITELWTPIEKIVRSFNRRSGQKNIYVSRKQYPLVVAEAITVHKSQGDTYSDVVVHLNVKRTMKRSQLYVACSRAKTSSGLFIAGKFKAPNPVVKSKDPVALEMERLRKYCPLTLPNLDKKNFIYVHNVQSLNCHLEDVSSDLRIMESDMIFLVETWAKETDEFKIPGFLELNGIYLPRESRRKPYGVSAYVKENVTNTKIRTYTAEPSRTSHIECLWFDGNVLDLRVSVLAVYCSPACNIRDVIYVIGKCIAHFYDEDIPSVIVGDFNINLLERSCVESKKLLDFFSGNGFEPLHGLNFKQSTDGATQLDLAFGNVHFSSIFSATYRECYYSYHKGICLYLK